MIIGVVLREILSYQLVEQIALLRCCDLGCLVIALLFVIV